MEAAFRSPCEIIHGLTSLFAVCHVVILFLLSQRANNQKSNASSGGSSYSASSGHGTSDQYEGVAPSGSTPSEPSSAGEHQSSTMPPTHPPTFGRPPRLDAADPPAGSGNSSVGTRLTKMGIEVPVASESSSIGIRSSNASATSHSEASGFGGHQPAAASVQGTVTSSLTKFGIEVPKYETTSASVASVFSDGKSMATSLTRMGVEMPLDTRPSEHASSTHSQSGASQASHVSEAHHSHHSHLSHQSRQSHQSKEADNHQALLENGSDPAVHSIMSGTDDGSSVLRADDSRDFGGLARQQLVAELREATNLMAESRTQEAAKFWRDHVLELEARLKALDGGEDVLSISSGPEKPAKTLTQLIEQSQSRQSNQAESFVDETPQEEMTGSDNRNNGHYVPPSSNASHVGDDMQNAIEMGSTRGPLMIDPSLEGVPMVDVVAPADLPGGYHFEAEIEGRRFLETVPKGGVQKGETFSCYMRDLEKVGSDIPVGRWRDGLFDCFKFGCCHGVICNALFCPLGKLYYAKTLCL